MRRAIVPGLLAATKLVVSLGLLWSGFRAVSDDDYARVTIAQHFALEARLDPTGTSWLPLPFWIYGGAMKVFGPSLATAQSVALLLGASAAAGMWLAARMLVMSPRAALLGSLIATGFAHSAYYGAATVPDYPTAVVTFLAIATLNRKDGQLRFIGAMLAAAATLCRYETWPVACVTAGFAVLDAVRHAKQRRWYFAAAAIAPSGAMAWMSYGLLHHHDPWFFIKRVSSYRRALGADPIPFATRLLKQPLALLRGEPELIALVLGLGVALLLLRGRAALRSNGIQRPVLAIGSLVAFLLFGDLLDGAPTHHEDRTLLTAWLGLALLAGAMLDRLFGQPPRETALPKAEATRTVAHAAPNLRSSWQLPSALGGCLLLVVLMHWLRPVLTPHEPFVDRSNELAIGRAAARLLPAGARIAICTLDYGYFAIQAAIARPLDAPALLRRDPRQRELDPLSDPLQLRQQLDAMQAKYLIVPTQRLADALPIGRLVTEAGDFALIAR